MLIEYDAGTSYRREYEAKFEAYADFQHETHALLPPILVVTLTPHIAPVIRESINAVGATDLRVVIVSITELLQHGLE